MVTLMAMQHEFDDGPTCKKCKKTINDIWARFSYNPMFLAISGGKNPSLYTETSLEIERKRILKKYHKCLTNDEMLVDDILEF